MAGFGYGSARPDREAEAIALLGAGQAIRSNAGYTTAIADLKAGVGRRNRI
jgi:hypothetical protein